LISRTGVEVGLGRVNSHWPGAKFKVG
jgi:hypothetical protein